MKLSLEEVNHIASLARLDLTAEEKARYCDQLSAILDYAQRLQTLETAAIAPTSSVLSDSLPLRQDVVQPVLAVQQTLANASETAQGQFKVPPVLDVES